jgi:hypothetical protein
MEKSRMTAFRVSDDRHLQHGAIVKGQPALPGPKGRAHRFRLASYRALAALTAVDGVDKLNGELDQLTFPAERQSAHSGAKGFRRFAHESATRGQALGSGYGGKYRATTATYAARAYRRANLPS